MLVIFITHLLLTVTTTSNYVVVFPCQQAERTLPTENKKDEWREQGLSVLKANKINTEDDR